MKKRILILGILSIIAFCGQTWALTPVLDGVLNEWTGDDVVNLGTSGSYTLLATWDETNLYIGVDRDASDRYLGDTAGVNDSFFLAIDVDGVAGSGGADGYGNVNFNSTMLPDRIYYYAGGEGWYEASSWNGSGWDWLDWTNANTYYGWSETNPNDELSIALSDIGGSYEVMVWAWMTVEGVYDATTASWPDGAVGGPNPTIGDGLSINRPVPHNPDPKNGAVVGTDSVTALSWINPDPNNPADMITCDVFFLDAGTTVLTEDPNMGPTVTDPGVVQLADDTTAQTVDLTTITPAILPLQDNHYYYWAVHSTDPHGDPNGNPETTQGDIWYFFTGDAPPKPGKPVDQYMWLSQDDSAIGGFGDTNPNIRYFQVTASYTDDGRSPIVDANFVNLNWDWAKGELGILEVSDVHDPETKTVTAVYRTIYDEGGNPDNTTVLPGYWGIRLEVTDGTGTAHGTVGIHRIFETCGEAAAADPSDDFDGYYDTNGDCIVNLSDFADFAAKWLYQGVKYE